VEELIGHFALKFIVYLYIYNVAAELLMLGLLYHL
jgi:hypothetical protein